MEQDSEPDTFVSLLLVGKSLEIVRLTRCRTTGDLEEVLANTQSKKARLISSCQNTADDVRDSPAATA